MGKASRRRWAARGRRWAAHAGQATVAPRAPSPEFTEAIRWSTRAAAAARARAPEEARRASAPCYACGKIMPAGERCAACVESGVWFCAACHAEFEGEAAALDVPTMLN